MFGDEEEAGESGDVAASNSGGSPLVSPSAGWAKFKQTNPDEFRTPLRGGGGWGGRGGGGSGAAQERPSPWASRRRGGRDRGGFGRPRGMGGFKRNHGFAGVRPVDGFPFPFGNGSADANNGGGDFGGGAGPFGGGPGGGGGDMRNVDPHMVETVIIPQMINQANDSCKEGKITREQV